MPILHLLYTNDFHNHLSAAQAEMIKAKKAGLPDVLLLDAGDAVSAGNIGVRPGGEPILTRMSEIGYDAMTLGNREFHIADTLLRCKISKAQFPILCANMRWKDDQGASLPVQASVEKMLPNGLRVGIFGVTVPMVTQRMAARAVSAFLFDDPLETARREIKRLRPQVDVLIALTHIGYREDQKLAAACPELDLIIGGHSHVVLPSPEISGSVPIVQAGWYGHYLGHVVWERKTDSDAALVSGSLEPLK
jgi:2',3'-cyclic-nucleotide 2'-phosphodiesterase (5'-nucleotidase family)